MLHYEITPLDPNGHQFAVSLRVTPKRHEALELKLPAWIPGSYMIRDFARNILDLRAEANGQRIPVTAIDKQTWRLAPTESTVLIQYQVYAFDLSVRSAYLDQFFGFFNNSSLCLAVDGHTDETVELSLQLPAELKHWRVATGMPRRSGDNFGAGGFYAENYEALIDYPFLLGELGIHEFIAGGKKHAFVTAGRNFADYERICSDLARICEHQVNLFEKQVPFDNYLFLTMVVGKGFGGLEHRNSTALLCSRKDLVSKGVRQNIDTDYRTFLSLCSHEYFHSWNIKTLKPRDFIPYQLNAEQYTRQLWFYEGITSYFDDYVLQQAGLIDAATYLNLLGDTLARVHRGVGVDRHTVGDSSLQAWNRFYKQDENAPNAVVSYYAKGALIALCLDLMLRIETNGEVTLGQVMAKFWRHFGADQKGTTDTSFAEFVTTEYNVHLGAFIERAVESTEPLPVQQLLKEFGIEVQRRPPQDDTGFGGKPAAAPLPVALGAKFKASSAGLELQVVFAEEAAHDAGLSAQDRIIAIDHLQVTDGTMREVFERYQPGDVVTVHAFRRDELLTLELIWQAPKLNNYILSVADRERAQGWLALDSKPEA
ncbi:M61 family metallopeptidase [Pseudidiomarina sp. 1APR75-33.1]|uniref:M61 family metallopeptidase n=1 Tax=Pseudidiomarina terrestris TaxID=2820060 RepID=UPI002651F772|nr:PDZ domain-containing protein [Pseudidiomarina sp. 1APR75-33.1]MDN7126495.1 M61 family metallopeptidase [Pseudidiomarina sp. 1APR75-33.1]